MFPCLLAEAMRCHVDRLTRVLTAKALQALVVRSSELERVQSLLQGAIILLTVAHWISLAWDVPSFGASGRGIWQAAPVLTQMAVILAMVIVPLAMVATLNLYVGTQEAIFFEGVLRQAWHLFHGPHSVCRPLCLFGRAISRPCLRKLSMHAFPPLACRKCTLLPSCQAGRSCSCPC